MGKFGIGQGVRRAEDPRLLTGDGRYSADISLPGQAHAVLVRSPYAHARIRAIETASARRRAGVLAIYTAADLRAAGIGEVLCLTPVRQVDGSEYVAPSHPLLADEVVRHIGDPVAIVVAATPEMARDAAEAVEVDYEALPAVVDTEGATEPDAPQVWEQAPKNTCFVWGMGDREATEEAFASAARVVRLRLVNNRIVVNPLEPRVALGHWDGGRYTLYTPTQGAHMLRNQLARDIFHVPPEKVHVVTNDVGGGFGMKSFLFPEQALVLFASERLARPVKWVGERSADDFLSDSQGRDQVNYAELALDGEANFVGLRVRSFANLGAYLSNYAPLIPTKACAPMLPGAYRIPAMYAEVTGVFTHTVPVDAYRGAGRPEALYLIERLVDAAAREAGVDPAELRRRNFVPAAAMPYRTASGLVYDSGDFAHVLDATLERAQRAQFETRRRAAQARGRLRGLGFAYYVEMCGGGAGEKADVRVDDDGRVTVLIGTQSNGQGHETAYAQVVADRLGVDIERVRVVQGDTDLIATGSGTGGSRSIPIGSVACDRASEAVIEKARRIAAEVLEAAAVDVEFSAGVFSIAGTDRRLDLAEIARAARDPRYLREGEEPGLTAVAGFDPEALTYPNGCHVCEVEVDPESGRVEILHYTVGDDFGTVLNPLLLAGQVHGGIVQGIGQALHERCVYDPETGQLLSGSFMDYCMPRADDVPAFDVSFDYGVPCRTNPLGIKGAGEAGSIGAPPAVINAVIDALAPRGITHIDMPATSEAVWQALRAADAAQT